MQNDKKKPVQIIDPDQRVMSLAEWCALNGFSIATGKRLILSGQGPKVIQLSKKRIGIRVCDNRAWQESRVRKS
jgi:hypothetical protein